VFNVPSALGDSSGERARVYYFEGFGGNFALKLNGKSIRIPISGALVQDFYYNPAVKAFPTATHLYYAQDAYAKAESDIRANQYEFKIENNCIYIRRNVFVLMGYSAGGDAVMRVANDLNSQSLLPITLAFTIDPVSVVRVPILNTVAWLNYAGFGAAPKNVDSWVNYYQHTDKLTLSILFSFVHGLWGSSIQGAANTEVQENDFVPNAYNLTAGVAAFFGHIYIPGVTSIRNSWIKSLGNVVAQADAMRWKALI
jgi:hypothetical protein